MKSNNENQEKSTCLTMDKVTIKAVIQPDNSVDKEQSLKPSDFKLHLACLSV